MSGKKISYDLVESLIGSVWRFNNSDGCEVKLIRVDKALSKTTGKVLTFKHLTYNKPDFRTNETSFKKDFSWAERVIK